jgi:hypothetical protein
MYAVEFFADKAPGVDSGWDALHTFIRIPAGALLAAGAVGEVTPALEVAAGILGGGLAATTHATKAGGRLLINTSPEPFSNWGASIAEDVAVFGGLWAALHHPWVFFGLFVAFLLLLVWLVPKIFRALRRLGGGILRLFGPDPPRHRRRSAGPGSRPADGRTHTTGGDDGLCAECRSTGHLRADRAPVRAVRRPLLVRARPRWRVSA